MKYLATISIMMLIYMGYLQYQISELEQKFEDYTLRNDIDMIDIMLTTEAQARLNAGQGELNALFRESMRRVNNN